MLTPIIDKVKKFFKNEEEGTRHKKSPAVSILEDYTENEKEQEELNRLVKNLSSSMIESKIVISSMHSRRNEFFHIRKEDFSEVVKLLEQLDKQYNKRLKNLHEDFKKLGE